MSINLKDKLLKKILNESKESINNFPSMTNKLALLCTVFSIVNCVILVLISFESNFKPIFSHAILVLLGIVFLLTYITFKMKKVILAANLNLMFLNVVYLPIMWMHTGGISGSASLILFMLIIFNAILNHGRTRFYIATSQFSIILSLFFIELNYPQYITRISTAPDGQLGVMLNMFYILFSTTLVTAYFIDQYESSLKELSEANDNLKQAAQFRRDLTANISHDLNTPITMICGYAEAITDGLINEKQTKKYLNLIHQKSMDLSVLIDDLLQLTELENGQLKLNIQPVKLCDLIEEQEVKFIYDIQHKGLCFFVKAIPSLLKESYVLIDHNQINKVFSNILYNALKFTDIGSITLSCSQLNDEVLISIKDTGPGIERDALPFIFNRFYKASTSRNSQTKGSGIGLNISQQIIDLHGCKIWVESDIGVGSTFHFTLPLDNPHK